MAAETEVRVGRADDGTIRITAAAPGTHRPAFTQAVLDVAGAVLVWPVAEDPGPPTAYVHDVGRAQQWLWAVYGERTAAAVHACAAAEPDELRAAADATALAGSAARLAFGHWAARWWPASYPDQIPALEPDVLGLELAALSCQCQQLFDSDSLDDQPDDCAAQLIGEHQAGLDPLIRWWHSVPAPSDTARLLENVLRLVDAAADNAGLDTTALRRLRSSLDQRPAPGGLFTRPGGPGGYALAAGTAHVPSGRVIARGTGVNDWRRYPPGLVDAAENAVTWTARATGARREIEVEVLADAVAPAVGVPLVAEVRVDGGTADRIRLGRRDDLWTGRADLNVPATGQPHLDVQVLLPGFDPGAGADVRADRDAIRSLVRRRLAAGAEPAPRTSPMGPFLAEIAAATTTEEDY
ncbi:hypothetical protein [Streptomyces sp. NPDC097610]|uniref:hypothetical protein n=1 Tax=Streptomyces sp. NPDC097610 TaxID=3157227 RepID=UPI00332A189E